MFEATDLNLRNKKTEKLFQILFGLMTVLLIIPVAIIRAAPLASSDRPSPSAAAIVTSTRISSALRASDTRRQPVRIITTATASDATAGDARLAGSSPGIAPSTSQTINANTSDPASRALSCLLDESPSTLLTR